jgi:hypothetical protein
MAERSLSAKRRADKPDPLAAVRRFLLPPRRGLGKKMRQFGMIAYFKKIPGTVPKRHVVVHNQIKPALPLRMNGFRAWLSLATNDRIEPCPCKWAPNLGTHYRVRRPERTAAQRPTTKRSAPCSTSYATGELTAA